VLWSEAARDSDWVEQERIYYAAGTKESTENRRTIFVNLDSVNKAQARYEQINNIKQAGLYAQGPASFDINTEVRLAVLNRLEEALKEDDSIPIYKILLVSTLEKLQNTPLATKAQLSPSFNETLRQLGIKTDDSEHYKTELAKYYGPDRSSWKPFGSAVTIDAILDNLRNRIQATANAPRFRWRDPAEEFWSDEREKIDSALKIISQHLSLLVIDPISLYDSSVMSRLLRVRTFLRKQMCATAVLAPFKIPPTNACIREVLEGAAVDIFNQYSEPAFDGSALYPLSLCAHDDIDVRRVLCASLNHRFSAQGQVSKPAYLLNG